MMLRQPCWRRPICARWLYVTLTRSRGTVKRWHCPAARWSCRVARTRLRHGRSWRAKILAIRGIFPRDSGQAPGNAGGVLFGGGTRRRGSSALHHQNSCARRAVRNAWYRKGEEFRYGQSRQVEGWRTEFLQKVPLPDGSVRFPGGRAAWTTSAGSGDEVLLDLPTLEALVPIAEMNSDGKSRSMKAPSNS